MGRFDAFSTLEEEITPSGQPIIEGDPRELGVVTTGGRFDKFSTPEAIVAEEQPPEVSPFMLRGIASGLGAPVDLVDFGLDLLGLKPEGVPAFGSENIEDIMSAVGLQLPAPGDEPTTAAQRVGRGVGEAAGFLIPGGAVVKGLASGTGAAAKVAQSLIQGAASSRFAPIATVGGELVSGGASGLGGQVAVEHDIPEALGQLAGGLTPAGVGMAGKAAFAVAKATPITGTAIRAAQGAIVPFTKAGSRVRAERRAQGLVSDPEAAAARLGEEPISQLTVAQQADEKRLLSLEQEVLSKDVPLESEFGEQTLGATQQLRDELATIGRGDVEDTRSFIERRRDRLTAALDLRAQQAAAEAQRRVEQLQPERRAMESSVIVREEIENALGSARTQEDTFWGEVPRDTSVVTENVRSAYNRIFEQLPRAQREDIPDAALRFLGGGNEQFQVTETVNEMHGLYSKLREKSRIARSNQQFNTARISDELADSILDDFDTVQEVSESFETARTFSRDLNERFTQGAVGRILGRTKQGGPGVSPELTLQTSVGRGRDRGTVEAAQILAAAPGARTEIGQFILSEFERASMRGDKFNPAAARKFVTDSTVLENFPGLRQSMLEAAGAQERATRAATRETDITSSLRQSNQSQTATFLDARPDEEISRVIASKNPGEQARQLRLQVRKDETGEALAGLKSASIDHVIRKSETGAFDEAGERLLSGRAMKAQLKDKKTRQVLSAILSPDELKRMSTVADELAKIEAARGKLPEIGGIISDVPSSILDTIARVSGAQVGRVIAGRIGGGTVQTPGIFSGKAREFLGKLTNDKATELLIEAVQDKELMAALLSPTGTPKQAKIATRKFNAWLVGPGLRFTESFEEQEQE